VIFILRDALVENDSVLAWAKPRRKIIATTLGKLNGSSTFAHSLKHALREKGNREQI